MEVIKGKYQNHIIELSWDRFFGVGELKIDGETYWMGPLPKRHEFPIEQTSLRLERKGLPLLMKAPALSIDTGGGNFKPLSLF